MAGSSSGPVGEASELIVLALDSATEEIAVGLGEWPGTGSTPLLLGEPRVIGETNIAVPRAALTHLIPMITRLVEECGLGVPDIGGVIVGLGPGSFTGVRIAVATAKGLAQGLGAPLWGVGTPDAVAERFAGRDGIVAVVGDAMRKEVYPALFRASDGGIERLAGDRVAFPADVAGEWAADLAEPVLLAGEGLAKYADVFQAALGERATIADAALWRPTGGSLLAAAWRAGVHRRPGSPDRLLPTYTRMSDAEEAEAARRAASS